jgi:nucleotide-binding universal stress UspA family protein
MFPKIRIIVGIDGSLQSKKALDEAISIAKHFSGFIKAVSVYDKGSEKKAELVANEAGQLLSREGVVHESIAILGSNPAKVLETTAKQENFDLIVVGSRGLGGRVSIFLGSVSKEVVGNAYCNVLVVKR